MNKNVVILGCPRSGTSLLAQLVTKAGFDIDSKGTKQLMRPNPSYNPDGYYERIDIVKINDLLIKQINSEYNFLNPPSLQEIQNFKITAANTQFNDIKKELLHNNGWAIKDSRLAFTLHFYELVDIIGIKITRIPDDVKKSMINHYGNLFLQNVKHGPHYVKQVDFNKYYVNINECIDWQFKNIPHISVTYENLLKLNFNDIEEFLECKFDKNIIKIDYRNYGNM